MRLRVADNESRFFLGLSWADESARISRAKPLGCLCPFLGPLEPLPPKFGGGTADERAHLVQDSRHGANFVHRLLPMPPCISCRTPSWTYFSVLLRYGCKHGISIWPMGHFGVLEISHFLSATHRVVFYGVALVVPGSHPNASSKNVTSPFRFPQAVRSTIAGGRG